MRLPTRFTWTGCSDQRGGYGSFKQCREQRLKTVQASADEETAQADRPDDGDLLIEEEMRNRRRKKKSKLNVVAPQVQQAYGGEPPTVAASLEGSYLTVLGVAFLIIMLEGVFIAVSGFLPESADQFAQDVVYPAFSPTVGVFLALSTLYGIWKSRQ
ncbi:g7366 [Coccomyxa elongata]